MSIESGYLLADLEDGDRVIHVRPEEGGVRIGEACDGYFSVLLSPERFRRFIADLQAIQARIEP